MFVFIYRIICLACIPLKRGGQGGTDEHDTLVSNKVEG